MVYKSLRAVCAIGVMAFVSGCQTVYSVPADAPSAKLRIVSTVMLGRQVWLYEDQHCTVGKHGGSMGYTGGIVGGGEASKLDMLDPPPRSNRIIERRIPAGQPVVFSVIEVNGENMQGVSPKSLLGKALPFCTVTTGFTPKADAQYEAVYVDDNGVCAVTVKELVLNADGSVARVDEPTAAPNPWQCGMDGAIGK